MSARTYITARQLDELRLGLSVRERTILWTLAKYRLASGDQLRSWFFVAHRNVNAATRATTGTMKRLHDRGLVDHLSRRVGGRRGGSATYIWHLSRTGHRLLARMNQESERRWPDFDSLSLRTLDHTLAITETAVQLSEAARNGACELIEVTPEPACWCTYLNAGGGLATLKPDLFAVTATKNSEFEEVWFIEVDRATESLPTIMRKADQYERYRNTGKEQVTQGVFPRIVWLTPDQHRADQITSALASAPGIHATHLTMPLDQFAAFITRDTSNSKEGTQ